MNPKEVKIYVYTKACIWKFTAVLIVSAFKWRQHKFPSNSEWLNHLHNIGCMAYFSAIKSHMQYKFSMCNNLDGSVAGRKTGGPVRWHYKMSVSGI